MSNHSIDIKQIISKVKQSVTQKSVLWPYPIALRLQKLHYSLTIQWVAECIQIYFSELGNSKFAELNKYIQQVLGSQESLTASQCDETARKIWYLPERDNVQTAVARLWWILWHYKMGRDHFVVMETTMAIMLLLPEKSSHLLLDRYLEAAVRIYEEYNLANS
jgi:hypothetical protein